MFFLFISLYVSFTQGLPLNRVLIIELKPIRLFIHSFIHYISCACHPSPQLQMAAFFRSCSYFCSGLWGGKITQVLMWHTIYYNAIIFVSFFSFFENVFFLMPVPLTDSFLSQVKWLFCVFCFFLCLLTFSIQWEPASPSSSSFVRFFGFLFGSHDSQDWLGKSASKWRGGKQKLKRNPTLT